MEIQYGDESKVEEIRNKCIAAKPRHGDLWCSISKKIRLVKLKTEEILNQVIELLN